VIKENWEKRNTDLVKCNFDLLVPNSLGPLLDTSSNWWSTFSFWDILYKEMQDKHRVLQIITQMDLMSICVWNKMEERTFHIWYQFRASIPYQIYTSPSFDETRLGWSAYRGGHCYHFVLCGLSLRTTHYLSSSIGAVRAGDSVDSGPDSDFDSSPQNRARIAILLWQHLYRTRF